MDNTCKENYRTLYSCQAATLASTYSDKLKVGDSCADGVLDTLCILDNFLDILCLVDFENTHECLTTMEVEAIIAFIGSKLQNCTCC